MKLVFQNSRQFLIDWNEMFPLDRWWRKKYNISFNSKIHRETSPLDIFHEWLEDELVTQHFDSINKKEEKRKEYQKTQLWLTGESTSKEQTQKLLDMFDDIDITAFNEDLPEDNTINGE